MLYLLIDVMTERKLWSYQCQSWCIRNETLLFIGSYNRNNYHKSVHCDYIFVYYYILSYQGIYIYIYIVDLNLYTLNDSDFKEPKDAMAFMICAQTSLRNKLTKISELSPLYKDEEG